MVSYYNGHQANPLLSQAGQRFGLRQRVNLVISPPLKVTRLYPAESQDKREMAPLFLRKQVFCKLKFSACT